MKKNYVLFVAIFMAAISIKAQKVILVNGGQFGNNAENVSVISYDVTTKVYNTIDSIGTQSVQDLLIDGNSAFVAAQDSIVKYDLVTQSRVAAASFPGISTKSLAVYNNYLLVGNFYGKSSHNLYIYNKNNLTLVDSIAQITKGASDILVVDSLAYIVQNLTTAAYTDSAGYLSVINLNTLSFQQDVVFNNNGEDLGYLLYRKSDATIVGINSNSISTYNLNTSTAATIAKTVSFSSNKHNSALRGDTLFVKVNQKIGALNFKTLNLIDTNLINYESTAFTYDTLGNQFYATSTDFFSYSEGKVFDRSGLLIDTLTVASAPELVGMYYDNTTSLLNNKSIKNEQFKLYPNPVNKSNAFVTISLEEEVKNANLSIFNSKGQLIKEMILNNQNLIQLNLQGYESGMYFIQLNTENSNKYQKVILK